jgi:uncharacterized protein (DUF433 family)
LVALQKSLGIGTYSIPEAAQLTGVHSSRIRRWLKGYKYTVHKQRHYSPPVWAGQLPPMDCSVALGFLDLQEVRFVDKFRGLGVGWRTIREVAERAEKLFGTHHPFCTQRFKTDGREIFIEVLKDGPKSVIVEVLKRQHYFQEVITPFLRDLEFEDLLPIRWWPMGHDRLVVLDPNRSFGKPIVKKEGVATSLLGEAFRVEGNVKAVAYWYDVSEAAVKDAVEFESRLAS